MPEPTPAELAALYALPAATLPPHTPREEIKAAARILRQRDEWATSSLAFWLMDTTLMHVPDVTNACERDGDTWPCHDIVSAQKVAETILIIGTEPLGDIL